MGCTRSQINPTNEQIFVKSNFWVRVESLLRLMTPLESLLTELSVNTRTKLLNKKDNRSDKAESTVQQLYKNNFCFRKRGRFKS